MTANTTLMTFPCDFALKVIGKKTQAFAQEIIAITKKHVSDFNENLTLFHESKQGHYLALTLKIVAKDQQSLDALYQELTQHPDIKMVL